MQDNFEANVHLKSAQFTLSAVTEGQPCSSERFQSRDSSLINATTFATLEKKGAGSFTSPFY